MRSEKTYIALSALCAGFMLGVGVCVLVAALPDPVPSAMSIFMLSISASLLWAIHSKKSTLAIQKTLLLAHALTAAGIFILITLYSPHWFFYVWCPLVMLTALASWYLAPAPKGT
jgi:hypothetical protein